MLPPYGNFVDRLNVSGTYEELKICVQYGTAHIETVECVINDAVLTQAHDAKSVYGRFEEGICNAIAGNHTEITEWFVQNMGFFIKYQMETRVHSKDPQSFNTRDDKPTWSDFMKWVIQVILSADKMGVTAATAASIITTDVFGKEYRNMFPRAIKAVGNYNEIYRRNLGGIVRCTV